MCNINITIQNSKDGLFKTYTHEHRIMQSLCMRAIKHLHMSMSTFPVAKQTTIITLYHTFTLEHYFVLVYHFIQLILTTAHVRDVISVTEAEHCYITTKH